MIRYDTKRNTNQQQHDNMENAGSVGNTGKVRLTNNDEEKYQMVPVPPGAARIITILCKKGDDSFNEGRYKVDESEVHRL